MLSYRMLNELKTFLQDVAQDDYNHLLDKADKGCQHLLASKLSDLNISGYAYNPREAIEELGLDEELVEQLVEDYVEQVTKSVVQFDEYLKTLENSRQNDIALDYIPFRELAHKNLGVARNLRIHDAQTLLYELMTKEDLNYLIVCLQALEYCAIKLKPKRAYDTIKLMKVKSSL